MGSLWPTFGASDGGFFLWRVLNYLDSNVAMCGVSVIIYLRNVLISCGKGANAMYVSLHNSYVKRRLLPGPIILFYVLSAVITFYSSSSLALPTLRTVEYVDLDRFMGKWYVIACIPTFIEKDIFNATETYRRASNGTIETTFTFTKGGFSGPRKTYRPTGFINNTDTNAVWGMQFIWPIKADFRIVYLDENYQRTVIAREKRDYVWLMSRDPILSEEEYAGFVQFIVSLGYSENQLRRVPQKWTDTSLN